jgi:hypothetical protein
MNKTYGRIKIWGFSDLYLSSKKITLISHFLKIGAVSKPDLKGEMCFSLNTDFDEFKKVVFSGKLEQIGLHLPKVVGGKLLAYFVLYSHPKKIVDELNKMPNVSFLYIGKHL